MIQKCTDAITSWLISCDAIKEVDREIYNYALFSFFLSLSPLFLGLGLGILVHDVKRSILIIMPFVIIRKFSGGYHTKHLCTCLLCSCLSLLLCIELSFYVKSGWVLTFVTISAAISLIIFSPIDSENRILDLEERNLYKRITSILVTAIVLLDVVLFSYRFYTSVICISIGVIFSASLQLPCILQQTKNNMLNRPEKKEKCCLMHKGLKL